MLTSDKKLKKMIIEEARNILQEAEQPGWLQHRLNARRARDWRRARAGSMRDVIRGKKGFETAPGGSLAGYDPRTGFMGAMKDFLDPRMRGTAEVAPEEDIAPEEVSARSYDADLADPEGHFAQHRGSATTDPEIFELEQEFGISSNKINDAINALEKAYQHAGPSENKFAGMLLELIRSGEIIKIAEIWADLREALKRQGKLLK